MDVAANSPGTVGSGEMSSWDWTVVGAYLIGIVAAGCLASRFRRNRADGEGYFLAGRSLTWITIGFGWLSTQGIEIPFLMVAVYLFIICSVLLVSLSWCAPRQTLPDVDALVWKTPWEPFRGRFQGLSDYRLWSGGLFGIMLALYWNFA